MLTSRYLISTKNLPQIMQKIVDGGIPDKFNTEHLKAIGFGGSQDRAVVPLLKEIGFLLDDGTPTQRYKEYRDHSRSRSVLGDGLRDAYSDLFLINEKLSDRDREAIEGRFKATHGVSDKVAQLQAMTFMALLKLADTQAGPSTSSAATRVERADTATAANSTSDLTGDTHRAFSRPVDFRYNIEIHLPATKEPEVYNAIFRSLREHILDG